MGATMLERRPLQDLDQGYTDDVRRFKPDVGSGRSDGEATTDAEVLQFPDPSWAGGICGAGAAGSHNDDHGHHRNLHRGRDDEEVSRQSLEEMHDGRAHEHHRGDGMQQPLSDPPLSTYGQALCVQMLLDFNLSDLGNEQVILLT